MAGVATLHRCKLHMPLSLSCRSLFPKARNTKTPADDVLGVALRPGQRNLQHSALKARREVTGPALVRRLLSSSNFGLEEHDSKETHADAKQLKMAPAASAPRSV